jgi:hypothetical protein
MLSWLRRTTLDVIGQAGFDHDFQSLEHGDSPNELHRLLDEALNPSALLIAWSMIVSLSPVLRIIVGIVLAAFGSCS